MQLTPEQRQALDLALRSRDSLFITGSAGTGKTVVLKEIVKRLRGAGRKVQTTAFTGLAALQVGGVTLSRLLKLGIAKNWSELQNPSYTVSQAEENLEDTTDLVIDEISLLSGDYLRLVDQVLQEVKGNHQPFGGLRVLYCGDFLQLPPVRGRNERPFEIKWPFQYPAFREAGVVALSQSLRQKGQHECQLLNELREGELTPLAELFMDAAVDRRIPQAVELHPRNADVQAINDAQLRALVGTPRTYRVEYDSPESEALLRNALPMGNEITFKEGAPVIVLINEPERNYYNGTQGRVVGMAPDSVLIETLDGEKLTVVPHEWRVAIGPEPDPWKRLCGHDKKVGQAVGMPLKLGWAATIHKSQGLTLGRIRTDVSSCWEPGHAYVALSRAADLCNVSLVSPFRKVLADPEALHFVKALDRRHSSGGEQVQVQDCQCAWPAARAGASAPRGRGLVPRRRSLRFRRWLFGR